MNKIKKIVRVLTTLPQITALILKGVKIRNFNDCEKYASFFWHFPFAKISKDNIVSFSFSGKKVKMACGELNPHTLAGIFRMGEYDKIDANGKEVIDVGAAIGDTIVYFALRGAKKIYGYEINERYFNLCQKNIELNKIEDVASVNLCGIAGNNKPLDSAFLMLGAVLPPQDRKSASGVKMKTLEEITEKHSIRNGILKIDTEGFEYEILGVASRETLRRFSEIFLEYHYGEKNIPEKLKSAGFKINIYKTVKVFIMGHPGGFQNMDVGYIRAKRTD